MTEEFAFMKPGARLASKMRVLMDLCAEYIEPMPDGARAMTPEQFADRVLGIVDTEDTAAAVEAFEK